MVTLNSVYNQLLEEINEATKPYELSNLRSIASREFLLSDSERDSLDKAITSKEREIKIYNLTEGEEFRSDFLKGFGLEGSVLKGIEAFLPDSLAGMSNTLLNRPPVQILTPETSDYNIFHELSMDYIRAKAKKVEPNTVEKVLEILFPQKLRKKMISKINNSRGIGEWDKYDYYYEDQSTKAAVLIRQYYFSANYEVKPQVFNWLLNELPILLLLLQEGAKLFYKVDITCELTGKYVRDFTALQQLELMKKLDSLGFTGGRIDIKCDFPESEGIYQNYLEYTKNGQITNTKTYKGYYTKDNELNRELWTIEIGSRSSAFYVRVYQKKLSNKQVVERFEGEWHRESASALWKKLIDLTLDIDFSDIGSKGYQKILASILFGQKLPYDTIKHKSNGVIKGIKFPLWFEELRDKLSCHIPIKIVVPKPEKCISKTFNWLFSKSKAIAKFALACPEMLIDILNHGEERLKPKDKAEMNYLELVLPTLLNLRNSNSSVAIP